LPVKLVRQRSRLKRAKPERPVAAINQPGNLPAIKLGAARVQLSRRKGEKRGREACYVLGNTFSEMLSSSSWRTGDGRLCAGWVNRYPIDVVKVPLVTPLTQNFTAISKQLIDSDMPKELAAALKIN
jgi:hypothetical protein